MLAAISYMVGFLVRLGCGQLVCLTPGMSKLRHPKNGKNSGERVVLPQLELIPAVARKKSLGYATSGRRFEAGSIARPGIYRGFR